MWLNSYPSWPYPVALIALLAGVLLCMRPWAIGIVLVWAAACGYGLYALFIKGVPPFPVAWVLGWSTFLLLVGYQADTWTRKLNMHVRWLNQQTSWGAAIGVLIAFFFSPTLFLAGALIGAWIPEYSRSRDFMGSLKTACGVVVTLFGPDGLRLVVSTLIAIIFLTQL